MEQSRMCEWEVREDTWGILHLNNPPQNYMKAEFVSFEDLKRWTSHPSLRGVVVTGKGRHFCAGADKSELFQIFDPAQVEDGIRKTKPCLEHLDQLPIPVVAAIEGVCFGGGCELALYCHIRVASEKSLFSFPETGLGIIPGLNGTILLPKKIGLAKAAELVLTGKTINAQEALQLSLIDYVVPAKEVVAFSIDLLKTLTADRPLPVIHSVMKSLWNARRLPFPVATEEETKMVSQLVLEQLKVRYGKLPV